MAEEAIPVERKRRTWTGTQKWFAFVALLALGGLIVGIIVTIQGLERTRAEIVEFRELVERRTHEKLSEAPNLVDLRDPEPGNRWESYETALLAARELHERDWDPEHLLYAPFEEYRETDDRLCGIMTAEERALLVEEPAAKKFAESLLHASRQQSLDRPAVNPGEAWKPAWQGSFPLLHLTQVVMRAAVDAGDVGRALALQRAMMQLAVDICHLSGSVNYGTGCIFLYTYESPLVFSEADLTPFERRELDDIWRSAEEALPDLSVVMRGAMTESLSLLNQVLSESMKGGSSQELSWLDLFLLDTLVVAGYRDLESWETSMLELATQSPPAATVDVDRVCEPVRSFQVSAKLVAPPVEGLLRMYWLHKVDLRCARRALMHPMEQGTSDALLQDIGGQFEIVETQHGVVVKWTPEPEPAYLRPKILYWMREVPDDLRQANGEDDW